MRSLTGTVTTLVAVCVAGSLLACSGSKKTGDAGSTGGGPTCTSPSDCPGYDPGCVGGVCGECTSSADCLPQQTCVSGSCQCQSSAGCNGDAPVCIPTTHACGCAVSSQCPGGLACDNVNFQSGYCVPKCTSSTDCTTSFSPYCDPGSGLCVPCLSDAQCVAEGAGVFCTATGCAACRTNADCQGGDAGTGTPICDGLCVECVTAQDCGGGTSCNSDTRTCGSCAINADCPLGQGCTTDSLCAALCIQGSATPGCAPCELDTECPASAPTCGANKQCVPTSGGGSGGPCNGNCIGTVCNTATNTCVQCLADKDCNPGAPRCDTSSNVCVQCLAATDCPFDAPGCADGFCGACKVSSDCPNGMTCAQNGLCQCNAVANCGGDAPICLSTLYCGCSTSSQCPTGRICDNLNFTNGACVTNCATGDAGCDPNNSNPDCEQSPTSAYYGLCLACLTDAECQANGGGKYCVFSSCVNCRSNADCSGGLKCNAAGQCN